MQRPRLRLPRLSTPPLVAQEDPMSDTDAQSTVHEQDLEVAQQDRETPPWPWLVACPAFVLVRDQ